MKRYGVQQQTHLTLERRGNKYVGEFVKGRYRAKSSYSQKEAARLVAAVKAEGGTVRFKNPTRTREGRVLRTEGHTKHASSELLLLRKKQKRQHKRLTRRSGRLSYQSAEYVLRYGSGVGGAVKRASGSGFKGDVWDWLGNTF